MKSPRNPGGRRRSAPLAFVALAACAEANELGHLAAEPNGTIPELERVRYDAQLERDCGRDHLSAAGKRELVRWPYLQKMEADAVDIMWVARDEDPGTVELALAGSDERVRVDAEPEDVRTIAGHQFVARLDGLAPATTYCYRVQGPEGTTLARAAFTTAPAPGAQAPVRFALLGDLGKRSSDQYAVLSQLEDVRSDFVLLAGDLAYDNGRREELEANVFGVYREMMGQVPFFAASGNHDYNTDDARPFRDAFGLFENGGPGGVERWYSFDWGPVHFTVLDTEKIGSVQRAWLEDDLAAAGDRTKVVLLHKPPFSSGSHGSDERTREEFVPVFVAHGVDLVLAGHDHDYERTHTIDGVTYVVSGGGGRGTRSVGESDFTAYSAQVAHFVHVIIDRGEIVITAIDGMGTPFDTFTISREGVFAPVRDDDRSR